MPTRRRRHANIIQHQLLIKHQASNITSMSCSLTDAGPETGQSIDLKLIALNRGLHPVSGLINPFHWFIFAMTGPEVLGTVYQLRGMPGNFHYPGPERLINPADLELSSREIEIGRVPADKIPMMEEFIQNIPISKAEHGFNCQNWTEEVLNRLSDQGWLDVSTAAIVKWFKDLEGN